METRIFDKLWGDVRKNCPPRSECYSGAAVSAAIIGSFERGRAVERERCIKKIYDAPLHITAEEFEALATAIGEGEKDAD